MTQATTLKEQARTTADETQELTDGFHLVIDALKLNGLTTIYGVPGIPITDFGRMAQAAGIRVLSFRHEQNAGYAAAIAGFLTKKPGICLTVSAPGFLNGLTALAHATTNCFPMILISGSSEREIRIIGKQWVVAWARAVRPLRKPGADTVRQMPGFLVRKPAMAAA